MKISQQSRSDGNREEPYRAFAARLFEFFAQDYAFNLNSGNKEENDLFKVYLRSENYGKLWAWMCDCYNMNPNLAKKGLLKFLKRMDNVYLKDSGNSSRDITRMVGGGQGRRTDKEQEVLL